MKHIRKLFIFGLCIATIIAVCGCVNKTSQPKRTPQEIHVFFTPGTQCEQNIIDNINTANKIDIAVYSITNSAITDAIIAAHKRGANVRIVTDKTQAKGKQSSVPQLRAAGIPVLTNKKHKIEHNKWAVFDDRYVVSGSFNWTINATKYNSENCIFFDQPEGMVYSKRFEYLWQLYSK